MMNNNKNERNSHRKKDMRDGIRVIEEKESPSIVTSVKLTKDKINKLKKVTDISTRLINKVDKPPINESSDDNQTKSFLKMSVKMNSYYNKDQNDKILTKDNSTNHCHKSYCSNGKSLKFEKSNDICSSCNNSKNKVPKSIKNETHVHVSIKSKTPSCHNNSFKIERNGYDFVLEKNQEIEVQANNCSITLEEKTKVLRVDLLLQFLDQMRHKVIEAELSFDTFRWISERLLKDKMEIEILLLIEMIVRAQVVQMTKLISKDLCQNKITPPIFVKLFLKQYKFLKSLSVVYKEIFNDYESTYLMKNNLSFDLISRAYFKLHMCDCPNIKEHISSGHLNVKLDCLYEKTMTNSERDQMKLNYVTLKSDFQDKNKWIDIDKTIRNILDGPDDILKSLVNYFNHHFAACFCRNSECKKECCNRKHLSLSQQSDGSYKEILLILHELPDRDVCSISLTSPDSLEYLLKTHNSNFVVPISKHHKNTMKNTYRNMYQALENIKPPSIYGSSSSNNSNGYNSCLSISSYEESSDDDDDDDKDERFFHKWKRNLDETTDKEETKPPTPVSFHEDDSTESNTEKIYSRQIFHTTDHQDEIEKFNQLYNQYLKENEHLLDNASLSSTSHMSVPDYLNTLEKADNLQSIIKTLMVNYRKNIDIQEKISGHSTINLDHDHKYHPPVTHLRCKAAVFSDIEDTDIKDDDCDLEFDELSKEIDVGPSTEETLEEFEKFLDSRKGNSTGKAHPNLEALVKTYRIYCNKLYKSRSKEDRNQSDSSEAGRNIYSGDSKQTVSGDESFDIPCDCLPAVNIEVDNCATVNISNNNMSSSETGSSSTSTENTGNNKVCNCCKCEMFGELNPHTVSRGANVVEKLRLKLQKRQQCPQKIQSNKISSYAHINNGKGPVTELHKLPDVDSLVEFINGPDKSNDATCQTPDMGRAISKKNKTKANKGNVKMKTKKVAIDLKKSKVDISKDLELLSTVCFITEELSQNLREERRLLIEDVQEKIEDEIPEKDVYDPVVEDFKRFCSNVVIPKHRKKLPIAATLMIDRNTFKTETVKKKDPAL